MDISFKFANNSFNYRVAGIIKKGNEILVEKKSVPYLGLIGGRVKIGESSSEAISREIEEETNLKVKVEKLLGFVENFYISRYTNKECHEILLIYELTFEDQNAYNLETIPNHEEKDAVYIWKPLTLLKKANFKPEIILDKLNKESFFHLINHD